MSKRKAGKIGRKVLSSGPSNMAPPKLAPKVPEIDHEFIKNYYANARTVALRQSPFIYSLLANYRVIATNDVPIAAVSENGVLLLNPEGMKKAAPEPEQGVSILLHEALHPGLAHHARGKDKQPKLYNIAADAVINEALIESGFIVDLPIYKAGTLVDAKTISRITGLDVDKIKRMDADEIYSHLFKKAKKQADQSGGQGQGKGPRGGQSGGQGQGKGPRGGQSGGQPGQGKGPRGGQSGGQPGQGQSGGGSGQKSGIDKASDKIADEAGFGKNAEDLNQDSKEGKSGSGKGQGGSGGDVVIQEGDPDLYREDFGRKTLDPRRAIAKAKIQAAMQGAGTLPAGLRKLVDSLLEPKVNWKSLLRTHMVRGMGSLVVTSWRKPSRRYGGIAPGHIKLTIPTVWALIDTSGSVTKEQLNQAMTEIYAASKSSRAKVLTIPWDAAAYEIIEAKNPSDIVRKVMPKITGGGGTKIEPALNLLLKGEKGKRFKNKDILLIISDGYIRDFKMGSVGKKLRTLTAKSTVAMFLTSGASREVIRDKVPSTMKVLEIKD